MTAVNYEIFSQELSKKTLPIKNTIKACTIPVDTRRRDDIVM